MPSADFCNIPESSRIPVSSLTMSQISQGKFNDFHCTPAGSTALPLDNYGLCGHWPTRPNNTALYPISVRQVAALLHASFRHNLAVMPLRFATLHRYQVVGGLSPPVIKRAWRTRMDPRLRGDDG